MTPPTGRAPPESDSKSAKEKTPARNLPDLSSPRPPSTTKLPLAHTQPPASKQSLDLMPSVSVALIILSRWLRGMSRSTDCFRAHLRGRTPSQKSFTPRPGRTDGASLSSHTNRTVTSPKHKSPKHNESDSDFTPSQTPIHFHF
ncbi:hypothetical protein Dimus_034243 [Dionaea muscipula]